MIRYIIIFLLLAIVLSLLGFWVLAGIFAMIVKVIALVFIVLFVFSVIKHFMQGKDPEI
ncbi:MAG: hypothetical protein LN588_02370 [Rickettsia endosymbiont of Bryobia graminum]|nr:hypothetical protein [Rickettsia endosymbiont of Bryobia graminum]